MGANLSHPFPLPGIIRPFAIIELRVNMLLHR